MTGDILLFESDGIEIYNNGYTIRGNGFKKFVIDPQSIMTIGDYIIFCRDHSMMIVHKFIEWKYLMGLIREHKRIMLVYDGVLYYYNCDYKLCNFRKICPHYGSMGSIDTTFSCKGTDNTDDFQRVMIKYLGENNTEYDPRLMKYPIAIFPEAPKVVPLDYALKGSYKFFDIIIRFID